MVITKYYNSKYKRMEAHCELSKGEQYDLMKRNNATLKESINWKEIFEDTVSFSDKEVV